MALYAMELVVPFPSMDLLAAGLRGVIVGNRPSCSPTGDRFSKCLCTLHARMHACHAMPMLVPAARKHHRLASSSNFQPHTQSLQHQRYNACANGDSATSSRQSFALREQNKTHATDTLHSQHRIDR